MAPKTQNLRMTMDHLPLDSQLQNTASQADGEKESATCKVCKTANKGVLSNDGHLLAAAMACAMTTNSNRASDWVAKNGEESVFSIIRKLVPKVNTVF